MSLSDRERAEGFQGCGCSFVVAVRAEGFRGYVCGSSVVAVPAEGVRRYVFCPVIPARAESVHRGTGFVERTYHMYLSPPPANPHH